MAMTGALLFSALVAAIGSGFQHGYNTGVVNAPQKFVERWIEQIMDLHTNSTLPLSDENAQSHPTAVFIYSLAVSIFCIGGLFGGFSAAYVVRLFGERLGLILNNLIAIFSAVLMGLSKHFNSYIMLIVGRFFVGYNGGLNCGLAPMYLSEIADVPNRGLIGSLYQLVITISILFSQIIGLDSLLGTENGWPIMFSLIAIPAILQILGMLICPESPKVLASLGKNEEALKVLEWLRGTSDVKNEMDEIKAEFESESQAGHVSLGTMLTNPALRTPFFIAIVIMMAQQLSGINAVIFYSTSIFKTSKLSRSLSQIGTIIMGAMNVAMTVISTVIVDHAGRKTLLLIGFGGMLIDTILLTVALYVTSMWTSVILGYVCILFVVGFVVMFAVGPGSIPWFLVAEMFTQNARPTALSVAVGVNWGSNFFVGLGFPLLQAILAHWVFIIFAILQFIFFMFILMNVPETKNRTIEDITSDFRRDK